MENGQDLFLCFCRSDGLITEVVQGGISGLAVGNNLSLISSEERRQEVFGFLSRINSRGWAVEWGLLPRENIEVKKLVLVGSGAGERILIVGMVINDPLLCLRKNLDDLQDIFQGRDMVSQGLLSKAQQGLKQEHSIYDELSRVNNELVNLYRSLAQNHAELQQALENIRTLRGLIPICASCKKVRNDQGYWQQVEEYVSQHTEADFSHGLCEECARKLYPEYFGRDKNQETSS